MGIQYIRDYYRVPAFVGDFVVAQGFAGVIVGASDQYLRVRLNIDDKILSYHPTDNMIYEDGQFRVGQGDTHEQTN